MQDQAQMFNGGVKMGLIQTADTRMAGYFIAMHCILQLRDPLLATINSVHFKAITSKKKMLNAVSELLLDPEFWNSLQISLRALFPPLRVLRLADKFLAGMDKLFYYVRMTDKALQKSADNLDLMTYFTGQETDEEEDSDGDSDESNASNDIDFEDFIDSDIEEEEEGEADEIEDVDSSIANNSKNLGDIFVSLWKKRHNKLVLDLAIAGKSDVSHTCQLSGILLTFIASLYSTGWMSCVQSRKIWRTCRVLKEITVQKNKVKTSLQLIEQSGSYSTRIQQKS